MVFAHYSCVAFTLTITSTSLTKYQGFLHCSLSPSHSTFIHCKKSHNATLLSEIHNVPAYEDCALTIQTCRYLKFTSEKEYCNRILVKSFTCLSTKEQCSSGKSVRIISINESSSKQQLRYLASKKKRYQHKKQNSISNDPKKVDQMSESIHPTVTHVSCGGQFEIAPEDSDRPSEWRKSETSNKKPKCAVPPDFRVWEPAIKHNYTNDKKDNGPTIKFKLLSYNVLAQFLLECHPYLYTECSPYNLKWKVRAGRLYEEITKLAPDILCLQEVQASHLSSFYGKFEEIGYRGVFKQKTGQRQDGCAIYYKDSLFELKDHCAVEFYQPDLPILNRDNIGMMVKLIPKDSTLSPFVVATTHLLYNPKRTDVRLAQLQVFLAEIDRFAYHTSEQPGHLPIILTGDFNSTPDSAVIKLLDRGYVCADVFRDSSDWKKIEVTDNCQHLSVYLNRPLGLQTDFNMTKLYNSELRENRRLSECESKAERSEKESIPESCESPTPFKELFNRGVISHSLNLSSIYRKVKDDGSYEATTFQDFWVTVDYIYFSYCSNLKLVERLRLPTATECDVLGRLPNEEYGSDHLALAAVFELVQRKSSL